MDYRAEQSDILVTYGARALAMGLAFAACKLVYLVMAGVNPWLLPWLAASDALAGILIALLAFASLRLADTFFYIALVFYVANIHYGLLFGSFMDQSVLAFKRDIGYMADSIVEVLRWPVLLLLPLVGLGYRPVVRRFARRLATWETNGLLRSGGVYLALIGLLFFAPGLSNYADYASNPLGYLAGNAIRAQDTAWANAPTLAPQQDERTPSFDFMAGLSHSAGQPAEVARPGEQRFNVVVLILESVGTESMRRDGRSTMPALAELADHGLYWSNFYAPVPMSIKSLFALHTGLYPAANMDSIGDTRPRIPVPTLAERFHNKGYRTALLHAGKFSYTRKDRFFDNRGYELLLDANTLPNADDHHQTGWGVDDKAMYNYAKQWIQQGDEPFFLTLVPVTAHHPYTNPEHVTARFSGNTPEDRYHNLLAYENQLIEDTVAYLKRREQYENTVFVIFGDHGEAFGKHQGNFIHSAALYEENIHIPLVISNPRLIKKPQTIDTLGSVPDIMPTLLDLLRFEPLSTATDGVSLLHPRPGKMVFFYTGLGGPKIGLRDGAYKFIYHIREERGELYNLEEDPDERHNIAAQHPDKREYYRQKVKAWRAYTHESVYTRKGIPDRERVGNHVEVRLTELPILFTAQDWGRLRYDETIDGNPFSVSGKTYSTYGLGTHADSIVRFDISQFDETTLVTKVGRDDEAEKYRAEEVRVQIWVDGETVYEAPPFDSRQPPTEIRLPVQGQTLSLVAQTTADGGKGDHVDWIEPRLVLPAGDTR